MSLSMGSRHKKNVLRNGENKVGKKRKKRFRNKVGGTNTDGTVAKQYEKTAERVYRKISCQEVRFNLSNLYSTKRFLQGHFYFFIFKLNQFVFIVLIFIAK